MANSITSPTYVQALPNAGAELEVGHNDSLSRTDVINRPAKGIEAIVRRLLASLYENAIVDMTDLATVTEIADSVIPPLWLTNKTGGTLAVGDVVAYDGANDKAVKLDDTAGSESQFVVARETVANNAAGRFAMVGAMTVNVTGACARGQYIQKSATTKTAADAAVTAGPSTVAPVGAIGLALTAASGGQLTAVMFGKTYMSSSSGSGLALGTAIAQPAPYL